MIQGPRQKSDGPISVNLHPEGVAVSVEHDGVTRTIVMGPFNAFRVFGALSFVLGVKLSTKVGKSIVMGTADEGAKR